MENKGKQSSKLAPKDRPVFLITTGRTGSTFLQRLLNCHKNLVIWGEHFGFLNSLAAAYVAMKSPNQNLYPRTPEENRGPDILLPTLRSPDIAIEWANPWSFREYRNFVKEFIEKYFASRLDSPHKRWGFKEIRYNNLQVLNMLKDIYPGGRFIFLKRKPEEVIRSKIFAFIKEDRWAKMSDRMKRQHIRKLYDELKSHYSVYDAFVKSNHNISTIVIYEELVAYPRKIINHLLRLLGLSGDTYDWQLAEKIIKNVLCKTKRDHEVYKLINEVLNNHKKVEIKGHLDVVDETRCSGWAFDKFNKDYPVSVVVSVNGKVVGKTLAHAYREDLKKKNIHPTGHCGFVLMWKNLGLELKAGDRVEVFVEGANVPLPGSPMVYEPRAVKEDDVSVVKREVDIKTDFSYANINLS
ncbi:sulfotransferase [Thermosulfurimonas dismutans]|uniref:Sulfotransferase n=1 Tax=Thermosulfurimonas dismutans TaxID=999894 RepID=A0A179D2E0_9BACT|nr:sulfotransferase [Thermosulfurimonas dismutans]OAQ19869.1 hypothetical protein TDIS_2049 [Thermosulfurimonas dismutans]